MCQKIESVAQLEIATQIYYDLKEESDKVTKALKPINEQIKSFMSEQAQSDIQFNNGLKVIIGTQNRSQVDKDKLVALLKAQGLTQAIKTVEIPDELEVERMVYSGILPQELYMQAIKENYIKTLKVVKK